MVILRNYLLEGRELEEEMGGEFGLICEETGNRVTENKEVGRGSGLTSAALVHGQIRFTTPNANSERKAYHIHLLSYWCQGLGPLGHWLIVADSDRPYFLRSPPPFEKAEALDRVSLCL